MPCRGLPGDLGRDERGSGGQNARGAEEVDLQARLAHALAVVLDESSLPINPAVAGACDLLGIDPLYVANEGKLLAVVAAKEAEAALEALRSHPLGAEAVLIGDIREEPRGIVVLRTAFGGTRIVDMLVGDPLPRIC